MYAYRWSVFFCVDNKFSTGKQNHYGHLLPVYVDIYYSVEFIQQHSFCQGQFKFEIMPEEQKTRSLVIVIG